MVRGEVTASLVCYTENIWGRELILQWTSRLRCQTKVRSAPQQRHLASFCEWYLCAATCSILTSGGIIPLLDGGITTRRSGLRLPIPMFPPGGGGDLVGMTLPRPLPLGVLRTPGEPLGLTKPFPAEAHSNRNTPSNHWPWLTTLTVIKQTSRTVLLSRHRTRR